MLRVQLETARAESKWLELARAQGPGGRWHVPRVWLKLAYAQGLGRRQHVPMVMMVVLVVGRWHVLRVWPGVAHGQDPGRGSRSCAHCGAFSFFSSRCLAIGAVDRPGASHGELA